MLNIAIFNTKTETNLRTAQHGQRMLSSSSFSPISHTSLDGVESAAVVAATVEA